MKTALLIHGTCDKEEYFSENYPSLSNSHWLPWLQKQLLMEGYEAQTPEMPGACYPEYNLWKKEFERYEIAASSLLVGHSCGGGFLIRWLSENPVKISRLVLVAPWLDPLKTKNPEFFEFSIDPNLSRRMDVHLLTSDNDEKDVLTSVHQIRAALPDMRFHLFPGLGHFCFSDLKTEKFPALRNIVLTGKI